MAPPIYNLVPKRLWDGVSDTARSGLAAQVEHGKIRAVVPLEELDPRIPAHHFAGCTLLPGLIDAHVHYGPWMDPLFLAAGVTAIRDVGNDLSWICEQRNRRRTALPQDGPAIYCCGHLLDGPAGFWRIMARHHADADAIRQSVREHVAAGVDQIKLYANLDIELLRAAISEAKRHGMTTLSHLGAVSAADAVDAGLDQIEHLTGCGPAWADASQREQDKLIGLFLARQTVLDPTLIVWERLGRLNDADLKSDPRRSYMPAAVLRLWDRFAGTYPHERSKDYRAALPRLQRFLKSASRAGVRLAMGTDTPFPHLLPGFSLHDEMALNAKAGLTPVEVLRAATSGNALALGCGESRGRIAAGYEADMVLVSGDPTQEISDIARVRAVWRAGTMVDPQEALGRASTKEEAPSDPPLRDIDQWISSEEAKASTPAALAPVSPGQAEDI